ncbi:MAG: DUF4595 domain-containing protein, partial [Bacteroidales bacterium]|nr:DUF4595 domain-containing protein [Bacteroidales bacterium]
NKIMKNLMLVVGMLCMICLSCANAENQTKQTDNIVTNAQEKPQNLVKQLLINDDDWQKRVVDFEYDESGRLVAVSTTYNAGAKSEFTEKATVTYGKSTIVCEGPKKKLTLRLDSDGFVKEEKRIYEDSVIEVHYKYNSGKLGSCGLRKYLWDGDNIAKMTVVLCEDDGNWYDTIEYKYSDVARPNIDVLAFSDMFGGFPNAESVASKGLVSKYMPSEIKGRNYNSDGAMTRVLLLTYKYTTDDAGRITDIECFKFTFDIASGSKEETNVMVKVVY